jgi:RNA polymerase sigma-70 factor (ECF subfamily)
MFATTRWSLVAAARDRAAPPARQALAELCRAYWYPVYAYVRRSGRGHAEAEDLTQEFFTRLLEKDALAAVDPARGRFRSFLLAACRHFLANQDARARARKRGGGRRPLPLDLAGAHDRYRREPAHADTPEKLFERRWALALLDEVLGGLRREYEAAGKGPLFALLKEHLTGDDPGLPHGEAARQLGTTEGAVKVAAHRLRRRYRELLRQEIAQTLADPAEVDDEIRSLFAALAP